MSFLKNILEPAAPVSPQALRVFVDRIRQLSAYYYDGDIAPTIEKALIGHVLGDVHYNGKEITTKYIYRRIMTNDPLPHHYGTKELDKLTEKDIRDAARAAPEAMMSDLSLIDKLNERLANSPFVTERDQDYEMDRLSGMLIGEQGRDINTTIYARALKAMHKAIQAETRALQGGARVS